MGTKIKIVTSEGQVWDTEFDASVTIESLKDVAVKRFYDASANPSDGFKVIYPEGFRTLTESHAIQDEKLKDNDVLLLTRRRKLVFNDMVRDSELKAPTKEQIMAATKDLPPHLPPKPEASKTPTDAPAAGTSGTSRHTHKLEEECPIDEVLDFQIDLRKILISLVSVMTTVLHGNADMGTICNEMKIKIQKRFANAERLHEGTMITFPPAPEVLGTPLGIVQGLIEAKKREFRPNQKAYDALKELGFSDEQVFNALRGNRNSKDLACEWLLGGKTLIPDDIADGLDPDTSLYKALVANPAIRLGMHDPKTMLACLEILESSGNASIWLGDTEMAPVLASIFKIYHAEKHGFTANPHYTN